MAKVTENLKGVVKGLGTNKMLVKDLAKQLGRTDNSVRSTIFVKDYKEYFVEEVELNENKDKVKFYSLSTKGLELLESLENNTKEEK